MQNFSISKKGFKMKVTDDEHALRYMLEIEQEKNSTSEFKKDVVTFFSFHWPF